MTKEELLNTRGHFTWSFGNEFFIEIYIDGIKKNYVWSDPEYGGDNNIRKYEGTYEDWCDHLGIRFGRDKGFHVIKNYCGDDVKII